jgi:hypothetical protein
MPQTGSFGHVAMMVEYDDAVQHDGLPEEGAYEQLPSERFQTF